MLPIKNIILAVLLMSLLSCKTKLEEDIQYLVTDAAYDKHLINTPNKSEITYLVRSEYPSTEFQNELELKLKQNSFQMCKTLVYEWQSYFDGSSKKGSAIFDKQITAINKDSKEIIFIVLSYDSENIELPLTDEMQVSIQMIGLENENEFLSHIKKIGLKC